MSIAVLTPLWSTPVVSGEDLEVAVALNADPGASTTVTVTSQNSLVTVSASPLTFTSGNYAVAQIIILSFVSPASPYGWAVDQIDFVATGGLSQSITKSVLVADSEATNTYNDYAKGRLIGKYRTVRKGVDITDARSRLIDQLYNGAGLPTSSFTSRTLSYTGSLHQGVDTDYNNKSQVDQLLFDINDSSSFAMHFYAYHCRPSTPNDKLIIDYIGNNEPNHVSAGNTFLAQGYHYVQISLPMACTGGNGSDNPIFTGCGSTQRNTHFKTFDSATFLSVKFYIDQVVRIINYMTSTFTINQVNIVGTSEGSFAALLAGAIDARIDNTFSNRAGEPSKEMLTLFADTYLTGYNWDTEAVVSSSSQQCKDLFVTAASTDDWQMSCASGSRNFIYLTNKDDASGLGTYRYNYAKSINDVHNVVTGFKTDIDNNPANQTHSLSDIDVNKILTELGDI